LLKHCLITGSREGGTPLTSGCSFRMRCMTATTVSPPNAGWPVAAKIIVTAQAKMSTALVGRAPDSCSGEM